MRRWILAAGAGAALAAGGANAQPASVTLHPQVLLHDSAFAADPMFHSWWAGVTRDPHGRLYLAVSGRGVVAVEPGAPPRWLRLPSGDRPAGEWLSLVGDTLAVRGWGKWHRFDAAGAYRGCTPAAPPEDFFFSPLVPMGLLGDGLTLGELRPPNPGRVGPRLVVFLGQHVVRTLYVKPPEPELATVPYSRAGGSMTVRPPPRADTLWRTASNGSGVVVVEQVAPAEAGTQVVRVLRLAVTGDTVFRAAVRVPVLATSSAWREREYAALLSERESGLMAMPRGLVTVDALRRHLPYPPYHPPVTAVVAGDDGSAWLRLSTEGDSVEWVWLDPSGLERARAVLPETFTGVFADATGLWGSRFVPRVGLEVLVAAPGAPPFATPVEIRTDRGARRLRSAFGCPGFEEHRQQQKHAFVAP